LNANVESFVPDYSLGAHLSVDAKEFVPSEKHNYINPAS